MNEKIVNIKTLRSIINSTLDYLERDVGVREFLLKEDFYYFLKSEDKYNMEREPCEHFVGQLYDDWDAIKRVADSGELASTAALPHLAPILDYMSQVRWFQKDTS